MHSTHTACTEGSGCRNNASSQHYVGRPPRAISGDVARQFVCGTSRAEITAHLKAETLRVHGGRVEFRSGVSLVGGTVIRGELELETADGERERRSVDLVVGADGVHSRTRSLLCAEDPSLEVDTYGGAVKTLTVSVTPQGNPVSYCDLPTPNGQPYAPIKESVTDPPLGTLTSFFFPAANVANPGVKLLIVNSRRGGEEVTVGITATAAWWDTCSAEAAAKEVLSACFPHCPTLWLEECARAIADAPAEAPKRTRFVTCSKLGSGRAVLIGDAAHAMSANIGMGCNSALLDGAALADAAVATGGDLDALAEQFTREHLPDVRAVSRVSRGIYDAAFVKLHGERLRAVAGAPYLLWWASTFIVPKLPGVLQPLLKAKHDAMAMHTGVVPLRRLEAGARAHAARLAATAAAVALGCVALVWKLGAAVLA